MSTSGVLKNTFDVIGLFQYYRIVAAYLVLLMHQQFWWTGTFLGGVKNAAVPLFAIMAGYLAVGDWRVRREGSVVKEMVGKKVRRILVPYAIWAVIYVLANNVVLDVLVKGEPFSMPGLRSWIIGGVAAHLWFLPWLFAAFVAIGLVLMLERRWMRLVAVTGLLAIGLVSQALPGETSQTILGYARIYPGRLLLYFMLGVLLKMFCAHKSDGPVRRRSAAGLGGARQSDVRLVGWFGLETDGVGYRTDCAGRKHRRM